MLLGWKGPLPRWLAERGFSLAWIEPLSKAGPLFVVGLTTVLVWAFSLDQTNDVKVVANIPAGLPSLSFPTIDLVLIQELLPAALLISIVGFLESVSVAKSLASKHGDRGSRGPIGALP